jgi:hypothetical protein
VDDDNVVNVAAEPGGSALVARWAGTIGFVLPASSLVVYPIWSFPGTQNVGCRSGALGRD